MTSSIRRDNPEPNSAARLSPGKRDLALGVAYVSLFAVLVLLVSAPLVDLSRIHLGPPDRHLNDQVGYITAARTLSQTGRLQSHIIYPSTLYQKTTKDYLYLPGHYYALAASYSIFRYGILQSYLPNLAAYLFCAVCLYLIGTRLYSIRLGFIAAALFILFPINILYAYTGMSEMTMVFSALLPVLIFIYLPERWRPALGGLALIIPLLFRETAIFLVIPLGLLIFRFQKKYLFPAIIFVTISLAVSGIVLSSGIATGRPSLLLANIFDERFETVYRDAVAMRSISPEIGDWLPAVAEKIQTNLEFLINPVLKLDFSFDLILFYLVLFLMLVNIVVGWRRREMLLLSSGLFSFCVFLALLSFYAIFSYRGLRVMLFTLPLSLLGSAQILHSALAERVSKSARAIFRFAPFALFAGLAVVSLVMTALMANRFTSMDSLDDQNLAFMEQLGHDDQTLLVAPYEFSLNYVYRHYPVRFSFVPKNRETLELLAQGYAIGSLVLPRVEFEDHFSATDFERYGLAYSETVEYGGEAYLVWRATPGPQAEAALTGQIP